jgi:plastocyanin
MKRILLVCVALLGSFMLTGMCQAATYTINVLPNGMFVKDGETVQLAIIVEVGDTVTWKNTTTDSHTATSDLNVDDQGTPLFNTQDIANTGTDIVFTQDIYEKACDGYKVPRGNAVHVDYFCFHHADMGGKLVVVPRGERAKLMKMRMNAEQ